MNMSVNNGAKRLALILLVAAVAGCGLPRSGPNKAEIFKGSVLREGDAFVVSVNSRVTRATSVMPAFGFGPGFANAGLIGSDTIAPGDVLSIIVFENVVDEPLLGNSGQRTTNLGEVQVDGDGFVFLPYAGRIKASGQSPEALRRVISEKLDTQTPDPQVMVQRLAGDGSSVSVAGAVGGQGVYPIERPTRTLSGMLAKAGGPPSTPKPPSSASHAAGIRARSGWSISMKTPRWTSPCAPATVSWSRKTPAPS